MNDALLKTLRRAYEEGELAECRPDEGLWLRLDRLRAMMSRNRDGIPETGAVLIVVKSTGEESVVPIQGDMRIGRAEDADLHIEGDGFMSGRHCTITYRDHAWIVTDERSLNGTFVNGARVSFCVLRNGDFIQLGKTTLVYIHSGPSE